MSSATLVPTESLGLTSPILPGALSGVPVSYTGRFADTGAATALLTSGTPRIGDLVLAEVIELGHHQRLENGQGRRIRLHPGARIIVTYGTRYSPDQFEAVLPRDLGPCQLVAGGGIAARVVSQNAQVSDATTLQPIGILLDERGERLSTSSGVAIAQAAPPPIVLVVAGSAMNSGKTTTGRFAAQGFSSAGFSVGAAKVTGSGSGNDVWGFVDGGAEPVVDFTYEGYPSTWGVSIDELVTVFERNLARLGAAGCEIAVVEIADGVYQEETAALLEHPVIRERMSGLIFAASDALCATAGLQWLRERGLEPLGFSGLFSASPLAISEFERASGHTVFTTKQLADAGFAQELKSRLAEAPAHGAALVGSAPTAASA